MAVSWRGGTTVKGQLGDGTTTNSSVPVRVCAVGQSAPCGTFLDDVLEIAGGDEHSLARVSGNEVRAWGERLQRAAGRRHRHRPVGAGAVCADAGCTGPLTGIIAVAAGAFHSMALTSDRAV